jgi:iron only hydrogenase large subunit-like protein
MNMNQAYPIFTVKNECQDCYKCVRHCPVKAIKIEDGRAAVMPERCIACGNCVKVCPVNAKKVRDDVGRAKLLLDSGRQVYVSLAPSWFSEFKGVPAPRMIAALRTLGFAGVGETALGAQAVSLKTAEQLREHKSGALLSSACPVTVDYIRKYIPEFTPCITALLSPALTHTKMMREHFGPDIAVVFIGPCIAKKNEADRHPDDMNLALTFAEIKTWFSDAEIDLYNIESNENDIFVPETAEEGALYPVVGGMNQTIEISGGTEHVVLTDIAGIDNMILAFDRLNPSDVHEAVFIECLACAGGCIHGPCSGNDSPGLLERLRIIKGTTLPEHTPKRDFAVDIADPINAEKITEMSATPLEMSQALASIGKTTKTDELNCGGCGYDTCRNFALALLEKKAEPSMCVSFLRKTAQKKANALLRCIPSGVVIVDRELKLVECNRKFAELFGEDTVTAFDAKPGMGEADLKRLLPFHELFSQALATGNDYRNDSYRVGNRLLNITIFNIEKNEIVGGVITDVTKNELRREQIADRAREVINKNLSTVQDIACKLGEHMAETEILLRSISEDYADDKLLKDIEKFNKTGDGSK